MRCRWWRSNYVRPSGHLPSLSRQRDRFGAVCGTGSRVAKTIRASNAPIRYYRHVSTKHAERWIALDNAALMNQNMNTTSQKAAILKWLRKGESITPLEALRIVGSMRLGARIYELRSEGYRISTQMVKVGTARVASYRLQGHSTP